MEASDLTRISSAEGSVENRAAGRLGRIMAAVLGVAFVFAFSLASPADAHVISDYKSAYHMGCAYSGQSGYGL